jgi:hypothetical protein
VRDHAARMLTLHCLNHGGNSDFIHVIRGNCRSSSRDGKIPNLKSPFAVLLKYLEFIMLEERYFKY